MKTEIRWASLAAVVVYAIVQLGGSGCATSKKSVPAWDKAALASCWNGANAGQRMMNIASPLMSDQKADAYIGWMKSRGVTAAHVILANAKDGENAGYCIYGPKFDWTIDAAFVGVMKSRIAKLRKAGLSVVVWLITDDSSAFAKALKTNPGKYLADLKAQGLLSQASTVVLALEANEYLSASDVNALAQATRANYKGKIGSHQTSGRCDFAVFADIVFYQVDPGKPSAWIQAEAARIKAATGKPLNFFEIERQPDRAKSEAALRGGAFGVENW